MIYVTILIFLFSRNYSKPAYGLSNFNDLLISNFQRIFNMSVAIEVENALLWYRNIFLKALTLINS